MGLYRSHRRISDYLGWDGIGYRTLPRWGDFLRSGLHERRRPAESIRSGEDDIYRHTDDDFLPEVTFGAD